MNVAFIGTVLYPAKTFRAISRKKIGTIAPTVSGSFVIGLEDGVYGYDFDSNASDKWCDPMQGCSENRFNDGKAGPDGRFYIGSMGPDRLRGLYRVDEDRSWTRIETDITCSNGLVWSLDHRTFYYIDSPTRQIVAYDFDCESGSISGRRIVVECVPSHGFPDGMTIDSDGMLWVAHWQGFCVRRWNPDTGEEIDRIELPVERVTSCAFGGSDLRDLYITTASVEMSLQDWESYPQSGGLFRKRLEISGVPSYRYNNQT